MFFARSSRRAHPMDNQTCCVSVVLVFIFWMLIFYSRSGLRSRPSFNKCRSAMRLANYIRGGLQGRPSFHKYRLTVSQPSKLNPARRALANVVRGGPLGGLSFHKCRLTYSQPSKPSFQGTVRLRCKWQSVSCPCPRNRSGIRLMAP